MKKYVLRDINNGYLKSFDPDFRDRAKTVMTHDKEQAFIFEEGQVHTKSIIFKGLTRQEVSDTPLITSHYKGLAIQPFEYSYKNKLDALQHTAIKYITRFREKGGMRDLLAAKHTIDILISFEYLDKK